ncbi:DUF6900 domain-containing protein [Streptococcus parasanguinis]|uniref:DUF6900 domain-containing protein n=1 Tax=Streptococcus parasanguinis TaxID=1318 RepID=UPI0005641683|nr:hypothetical protein [Streptococcus parasanguinis]
MKSRINESSLQELIRELYFSDNKNVDCDKEINAVANFVGNIPTLERQNTDSQDFHEISVWTLKEMLRISYELGKRSQNKQHTDNTK